MARLLYRLAAFSAANRLKVVGAWVAVLLLAAVVAASSMKFADSAFEIPGTDSARAQKEMAREFPSTDGEERDDLQLVFQVPSGAVTDAAPAAVIAAAMEAARGIEHVVAVSGSPDVSPDGQVAIATVTFQGLEDDADLRDRLEGEVGAVAEQARLSGMTVEVGGTLEQREASAVGGPSELLGAAIAFLVLVLTFGSLAAAGANMLVALVGVAVGILGVLAFSAVTPIQASTPILAVMLGLAVGIDYTLFILSRFRDELRAGRTVAAAVPMAAGTAGSAVVFAGMTVVIALLGLAVVRIPFITEMGAAAAVAVVVAVLVSLTLGPVLMRTLGHRALPRRERRALATSGTAATTASGAPLRIGLFERWAAGVTRRPARALVATVVALAVLAVPVASLDTALSVPGGSDPDSTERRAYDIVAEHFGAGYQSPLVVLVQAPDAAAAGGSVGSLIAGLDHVAAVSQAQPNAANTAAILTVTSTGGPTDGATAGLVEEIRSSADGVGGATVSVTGSTAVDIDVDTKLGDALIQYVVVIVALSMVLLIVLFRSILVPVVASLGFLLTLLASFGMTVAVFQWGWFGTVFGVEEGQPILSLLPIIIVGILFGLAMDYQVFLVSRIHEAHVRGLSTTEAIHDGFGRAAAIVAAAATIMAAVFFGFGLSGGDALVASLAFALATGVLVDAFVVRMVIVPATLTLVGKASWWIPGWLDRLLPTIDTEGRTLEAGHGETGRSSRPVSPLVHESRPAS